MAKLNAEQVFRAKSPAIMAQLIRDFPITPVDAAAILGNLGHESAGLTILQEIKPTVPGSKGGYGWAQWTGPRRRAFEAYCARTGKDPASDEANYAYLFLELKGLEGSEKAAIGKLVAAKGLDAKVEAFERAFLRAGVKHYPSRKQWAAVALDAWRAKGSTGIAIPKPTPEPPAAEKPERGRAVPIIVAVATLAVLAAAFFFVRF
ncbi:phage tail tip lysozyme [Devosia sp. A449]